MNQINLARSVIKAALGGQCPVYVQMAVTKRCNLSCLMCNSTRSRQDERELGIDEIARLAHVLAQMRPGVFILTGGEPFVRKDLVAVYRAFVDRGIVPRLQTNGLLAKEETLRQLVGLGLREVTLSLDSLDEARQDAINGRPGTWRKIIEALALFSHVLPRKANMSGVNVVVSKRNVDEAAQVVEFIDTIGFYASIIPVHVARHGAQKFIIRKSAPGFEFEPSDFGAIDRLYERLLEMKAAGVRIQNSVRFLRESPEFLKSGRTNWRCDSPRLFFSISPSGGFLPCVDVPYERSMLDGSFLEDYRSGKLAREIAPLVEACPGCMYACWPEVKFACSDLKTLLGRGVQALKLRADVRPELSADEMFDLAASLQTR